MYKERNCVWFTERGESNFSRDVMARAKFLLIQMYNLYTKFLTCCRCVKKLRLHIWYRSASSSLPFSKDEQKDGSPRTFHSLLRKKIFTSRRPRKRNLTEIGLEIPEEGRVNFHHLARRSLDAASKIVNFRQKSSYLERTTKKKRPLFYRERKRDLNCAFHKYGSQN